MLDLGKLAKQFNMKITGAIIVGAHEFREENDYRKLGVNKFYLIEPLPAAGEILHKKYGNMANVEIAYCACGETVGNAILYADTGNDGQSSSLLCPYEHTKHYPNIKFETNYHVFVHPLDNLINDKKAYNFMSLDVQGFEEQVLKGAKQMLKHIDYILAEVNRPGTSMYIGCTTIDVLDTVLWMQGFKRVTKPVWVKGAYSDALYIKRHLL